MSTRTSKEALIAQMLGELDTILNRVEALPTQVDAAGQQIAQTVAALVEAGQKYREAVTRFTEDAKTELTEFIERKAGNVATTTAAEQRAVIVETARKAVAVETAKLSTPTKETINRPRSGVSKNVIEHAITAAMSSIVTAAIVYTIIK